MPTLDGKTWSLSEQRGKVVVLNFWATWCEPCRTEVPYLIKLRSELGGKGLDVAGITLDEDVKIVEKFAAEYRVGYPILIPPAGSPWTKLENTPTTLLIDREGRLAGKYIGAVPEAELRRDVEKLLAEPRPN
jgi:thiol-disulfide isomerase/thioredoxin